MNIYIFSEFYSEDLTSSGYYITEIARDFALTHEVTVITTSKVNKTATLIENGVNIRRINIPNFNKFNLLKRALAFMNICHLFYREALKLDIDKESHVIAVTNPALFIPFIAYLKNSLKFKLTIFVHDVFPESLVATKVLSSYNPFYLFLLKIFNKSYLTADQIIVCGRDMQMLFESKLKTYNGNLKFIPNWADGNLIYPIKKQVPVSNKNKLIFQYSGNIGRAQGIPTLIDVIKNINSSQFEFHFYGKGTHLNSILQSNNKNIFYNGSFSRKDSNKYLNLCDIAIVTLEKNMLGLGVPSKTYNILCAGKPILYIGDVNSEIAIMIKENNIGYIAEPGNLDSITNAIKWFSNLGNKEIKSIQINCRNVILDKYLKENVLMQYSEII
jgi:glycosyltransferase involved in cell wall biosynthesis